MEKEPFFHYGHTDINLSSGFEHYENIETLAQIIKPPFCIILFTLYSGHPLTNQIMGQRHNQKHNVQRSNQFGMFTEYGNDLVEEILLDCPVLTYVQYANYKLKTDLVREVQRKVFKQGGKHVEEVYDTVVRERIYMYLEREYSRSIVK